MSQSRIARDVSVSRDRGAVRQSLLALRQALDAGTRAHADEAIALGLRRWLEPLALGVVALYQPIRNEPDLRALLQSWSCGQPQWALPVVSARDEPLRFLSWSPGDPLSPGVLGIPVPAGGRPVEPDALVIPCVGFDLRGYRLGYGGGYYDRTLAARAGSSRGRLLAVGVAYDELEVARLDDQPHDVPLDAIITPTRVLPTARSLPTRRPRALPD